MFLRYVQDIKYINFSRGQFFVLAKGFMVVNPQVNLTGRCRHREYRGLVPIAGISSERWEIDDPHSPFRACRLLV